MPVCFNLVKKGAKEKTQYQDVDVEICQHLGVKVDEKRWCHEWYNTIGFRLAIGKSFDDIRKEFTECENFEHSDKEWDKLIKESHRKTVKIVDFLQSNYEVNSWYEMK